MSPRRGFAYLIVSVILIGPANAAPVSRWSIMRGTDPFTGEPRRVISITDGTSLGTPFRIQCSSKGPSMFVAGPPTEKYRDDDERWIVVRIDSHPATLGAARGLKGTSILGTSLSRPTYEKLRDAKKIAIRIIETDRSTYDTVFEVRGTKEAMKAIAEVCPLTTAKDGVPTLYDPSQTLPPVPEPASSKPATQAPR